MKAPLNQPGHSAPQAEAVAPFPVFAPLAVFAVLAAALVWAYEPALAIMAHKWETDPQYSHGWLVPLFALGLLWLRRDLLPSPAPADARMRWSVLPVMAVGAALLSLAAALGLEGGWQRLWLVPAAGGLYLLLAGPLRPSWWGLPLVLLAVALKLTAGWFYFEWFDLLSFVPAVAGAFLVVRGRAAMAWAWPAIAFLVFMVPLPHTLETSMREPLRWIGTKSGTYVMQTLGLPAYAEGFVVVVGEQRIGVEEACSGLNMLVTFFALCTAVAIVSKRPLWERGLLILSAVPIALIANVVRIAVVGILHANGAHELAETLHRQAAWLMMPVALALLWLELWMLSSIFVIEEIRPMTVGLDESPARGDGAAGVSGRVPVSVRG